MKKLFLLIGLFFYFYVSGQSLQTKFTYSVYPPQLKTNKPPVLIMLHGYGSNEADLFGLADKLDKRLMIISLRAPRSTKNGGFCWYDLDFLANGEFKYNYKNVVESKKLILEFIKQACKEFYLVTAQVFLMGFSQGAIMSYDIALSNPTIVKGVLALSGRMLTETKQLILNEQQVNKLNFFIAHGSNDAVIKPLEAEKAHSFVKSKTTHSPTYKIYSMGHSINEAELKDIQDWLKKQL